MSQEDWVYGPYEEWRNAQLGKGVCPDSGDKLTLEGEAGPTVLSCELCDCFGYDLKDPRIPIRIGTPEMHAYMRQRCVEDFTAQGISQKDAEVLVDRVQGIMDKVVEERGGNEP